MTIELEHTLRTLIEMQLVKATPPIAAREHLMPTDPHLETTRPVAALSSVLGVSLRDLASSRPEERMVVVPILGAPDPAVANPEIFVAMPFDQSLDPIYRDHIAPIARELGASIARADDLFTARQVITDIWSAIVGSSVIIADCTGRNPNVFYEIGLAHAIGRVVVLVVQDEADIPFDLRHLRYIRYVYTPPGMKRFEAELRSVLSTYLHRDKDALGEKRDGERPSRRQSALKEAVAFAKRRRVADTLQTIAGNRSATTSQRVAALVALVLNRDLADVDLKQTILDQGADSIDMIDLVLSVEGIFEVALPESVAQTLILMSVQGLAEYIDSVRSGA